MVKPKIVKGSKGQWKPVFLDPKFFSGSDDLGVLGIEELTDYSLINSKQSTKEKLTAVNDASTKEEISEGKKAKKKKPKKKKGGKHIDSASNAEAQESVEDPVGTHNVEESNEFNIDDLTTRMAAWNGLGVPLILLRALAEKSFLSPTRIQALTLPAAIFGRRDILGAAETGSGKTLAFGLPILNGIIEELGKKKSDDETENDVPLSEEEVLNSDLENFDNDDAEDFDGNEDEENESDEEAAEADDDDDDTEDEDSVDDEEDEENNSLAGSDSDCDEYGNNSGSFGGTAQCVKVIDNITSGFPTVGESNSKTRYTSKPLYALILTPTRELAVQISQHLKTAAKYTTISIAVVVGGLSSQKQERLLNRGPEIVVATPGRLWELIQEGHPHLIKVDTLKYLAVDETDRMLERGHFEELQKLLTRINENEAHRKERQNFVFSATLALTHAPPRYIAHKKGKKKFKKLPGQLTPAQKLDDIMKTVGLSDPKVVDITEGSGVAEMLSEAQIVCALEQKDYYLYYFLQRHPGRTLVFCNSIEAVRRLSQLFTILGCVVWPLHAKMHQKARLKNLERFIASPNGVLLATDVAARGLDIPNVQHVIHYQIPRTAEGYVHRSGRTARAQQQGLTVVFIEPSEVIKFKRLFRTLSRDPDLPMFPVESEWMATIKERVHLARRLDKLELRTRRENSEQGWLDKAVKEMDILVSDDELPTSDSDDEGSNNAKKEAAVLRKQLNILLSKPVIPRGFSGKFPTQTGKLVVPLLPGAMSSNSEICKGTAVDALKQSVEDEKSEKRKRNNKRANLNKRKKRQRISKAAEEGSTQVMKAVTRTKSVKKSI